MTYIALTQRFLASAAFYALGALSLHAQTITPVILNFNGALRVVSITLSNPSEQTITFQTQIVRWTQPDGTDHYDPSRDLLIAPAIAQVAPHATQIFRVLLRAPIPLERQQAYRVVIEDVGNASIVEHSMGLTIHFSHRLPAFVNVDSNATAQPQVKLQPCAEPAQPGCVRLENLGSRYVQVQHAVVSAGAWSKELDLNTRVLAGAWWQWPLDIPAAPTQPVHVQMHTSVGVLNLELPAAAIKPSL